MRITIKHHVPTEGLTLPINYHHILQSVIYSQLRDTDYQKLHDHAYEFGNRSFRMFTFSELFGKYQIQDRKIIFTGIVSFKISSPDAELIEILKNRFLENGICYGEKRFVVDEVIMSELQMETPLENHEKELSEICQIDIHMISPICVYATDPLTGKTLFFDPGTKEFQRKLQDNFARKYEAFYGERPYQLPIIEPRCVLQKHRKVTDYKGFKITGWMGDYRLIGTQEYLLFWYNSGIGGKNSEGFGMFDVYK